MVILFTGYFNIDLTELDGHACNKPILEAIVTDVLEDTEYHFLCCRFQNVSVWYPSHNMYQLMILGCLCGAALREHQCYLRRRTWTLIRPPKRPTQEDSILAELWRAVPNTPERKINRVSWISDKNWLFIDTRVSLQR